MNYVVVPQPQNGRPECRCGRPVCAIDPATDTCPRCGGWIDAEALYRLFSRMYREDAYRERIGILFRRTEDAIAAMEIVGMLRP